MVVGIAFPVGSKSVLFIGRHAKGAYCYGPGTSDKSLEGKPDGQGNVWCYDPVSSSKGTHAYPYVHQIWAYDADDLLAVKAGTKQSWEVKPYSTFELAGIDSTGGATIRGAAYDPAGARLYVTEDYAESPKVHVFGIDLTK